MKNEKSTLHLKALIETHITTSAHALTVTSSDKSKFETPAGWQTGAAEKKKEKKKQQPQAQN